MYLKETGKGTEDSTNRLNGVGRKGRVHEEGFRGLGGGWRDMQRTTGGTEGPKGLLDEGTRAQVVDCQVRVKRE